MKTIFVINPKAGAGKGLDKLKNEITAVAERLGADIGFYITKAVGDAEKFARLVCSETDPSEEIRLIACGGDGTVNEVLNGIMGYKNAVLGVLPIGTGNDFVRNFPKDADFMNIEAQLEGYLMKSDVIKYSGKLAGEESTKYCINMFNIGFDCNVADLTQKLKTYPLLNGSTAYLAAIVGILVKKKGAKLKVELDGEVVENGPLLLTAIANGGFCGGGVNSAPTASINDGIMDVNVIYNVSRLDFVRKFPHYSKGTHMELPDIDKILLFKQCKTAKITPLDGNMRLCVDGEIIDAGEVTMEMMP
ncbi:MAG: hypothetical protein IKU53_04515, partial [Firmicutes bacterium]|nr:hypothetical protein [Bacillota bacterium]